MNFKTTWILVLIAGLLLGFIFFIEMPFRHARERAGQPRLLLPGFDDRTIAEIEIIRGNQVLRVERNDDNWSLVAPIRYPANQTRIKHLLSTIATLTTKAVLSDEELVARPQIGAEFGVSPPQATLILRQNGGGRTELLLGNKALSGKEVYFQLVGTPGIFVADGGLLDRLPAATDEWRDPAFLDLTGLRFDRLETKAGPYSLELQRDSSNQLWQITKPQPPARADSGKVEAILNRLQQAEVSRFLPLPANADLDGYGLQPPELELIFGRATTDLFTVQFGKSPTNDPSSVFARRTDRTNLIQVSKELLDLFRVSSFDLRDRHLLSFSSNEVDWIEVQSLENFVLQKQPDKTWRVVTPRNFIADQALTEELLANLADLEMLKITKDVVIDFASYGLNTPFQYGLKRSDPKASGSKQVLGELDFGRTNYDGNMSIYVRRPNDNSVYELSFVDYMRLPQHAYQVRDRRIFTFASTDVVSMTITQQNQTRKILRGSKGEWSLAPIYKGEINAFSPEATAQDLGQLRAERWVDKAGTSVGERLLKSFKDAAHEVTIELNRDGKRENYTLSFGPLYSHTAYASTVIDGEQLIFELPERIFQDVQRDLTLTASSPLQ